MVDADCGMLCENEHSEHTVKLPKHFVFKNMRLNNLSRKFPEIGHFSKTRREIWHFFSLNRLDLTDHEWWDGQRIYRVSKNGPPFIYWITRSNISRFEWFLVHGILKKFHIAWACLITSEECHRYTLWNAELVHNYVGPSKSCFATLRQATSQILLNVYLLCWHDRTTLHVLLSFHASQS